MTRSIAYRRAQKKRIRNRVCQFVWWADDDRTIGLFTNTRKPCSCIGCGNKRRGYGRTKQERWSDLEFEEELGDL